MNKKKVVLVILLDLVFLIMFNVLFLVLGGVKDRGASVWISYGFIHFAYLMVLLTPALTRKSSASSLFGMTICEVSSGYFVIEFILGLIFILAKPETIKAPLCTQVILAGIYLVVLIIHLLANETTADNLQRQEEEVAFIKTASSRVKALLDKTDEKNLNKAIESTYDLLHSSPSKSCLAAKTYEKDVMDRIAELEGAVASANKDRIIVLTREITGIMEERNRKVRAVR